MTIETSVWNKQFGVFIKSNECPMEGCFNTICKDHYCIGESKHGLPGVWEIDNRSGVITKPICCQCSEKSLSNINF